MTEAQAIAALAHPNIVQVHDYGRDTSATWQDRWQAARQGGFERFIVDFSEITYLSSMGLRVLLVAAKQSKLVVCRMSPFVAQLFELGGLSRHIRAADSVEAALKVHLDSSPCPVGSKNSADLKTL